jgi:ribosomal protein L14E/L6E/L27E
MYEIGRICIKLKGKEDAGKKCVIIDHIDKNHVMVDGLTRRKNPAKDISSRQTLL